MPQGDAQLHGVKAALAQVADVAVELTEVHLLRLQTFLLEIARVFMDFREGGLLEFAKIGGVAAFDVALPAILEAPGAGSGVPDGFGGKDAPREREGREIELEDREVGEFVAVGIEELVVEDASGFARPGLAEDPIVLGVQDGLGRFAFDDVAESLLFAIGLGQIELVEEKEGDGEKGGDGDDGNHQPVKAYACSLHGDDFAVAVEHAEGDQHGDEHGQGSDLVKHTGGEVDEVGADCEESNVVAQDVGQQIEDGEDQHEQNEAQQHHGEHIEELKHHVLVEDAGKDAVGCGALGARLKPAEETAQGCGAGPGRGGRIEFLETRGPTGDGIEDAAAAGHLPEEKEAADGEKDVGRPNGEEGGNPVLTAQGDADEGERVIEDDQQDGKDPGGALSAAAGGDAERNGHQHEHEAGRRIGEAFVQFDEEALAVGAVGAEAQFAQGEGVDDGVEASQMAFVLLALGEGHIVDGKCGDVGLLRLAGDRFVHGSIAQPHEQFLGGVADDGGGGGGGDLGSEGVSDIGHEDLAPVGGARS